MVKFAAFDDGRQAESRHKRAVLWLFFCDAGGVFVRKSKRLERVQMVLTSRQDRAMIF